MIAPIIAEYYTEDDFDSLGFHDCYIHCVRWSIGDFSLSLDLDYIVEWLEPVVVGEGYRFWISPAELSFQNVSDVSVQLDWMGWGLECQV